MSSIHFLEVIQLKPHELPFFSVFQVSYLTKSAFLLKDCNLVLAEPLHILFNLYLRLSSFPK